MKNQATIGQFPCCLSSKVCEKVALNQLTPYLKKNKRLVVEQSRKKCYSTETSLIVSMETILDAVAKRKLTAIVYLVMSKVFNSINNSILLQKLKAIWLAPSVVSWFNSYLSQRSHVVRINAALSDTLPVVCGVSPSSVLGTLLFSIYVNDVPAVIERCSTTCYLDDTKEILCFMRVVQHSNKFMHGIVLYCGNLSVLFANYL